MIVIENLIGVWILSLPSPFNIPANNVFLVWYTVPFSVIASLSPGRIQLKLSSQPSFVGVYSRSHAGDILIQHTHRIVITAIARGESATDS